jgi:hypothetical protein
LILRLLIGEPKAQAIAAEKELNLSIAKGETLAVSEALRLPDTTARVAGTRSFCKPRIR